jgi:hypothetical protein
MSCCGSSFCAECVQNLIVENPGRKCFGDGCNEILSVDAMIRNMSLRKAVENYKKKLLKLQWPGLSNKSGGLSPAKVEKVDNLENVKYIEILANFFEFD